MTVPPGVQSSMIQSSIVNPYSNSVADAPVGRQQNRQITTEPKVGGKQYVHLVWSRPGKGGLRAGVQHGNTLAAHLRCAGINCRSRACSARERIEYGRSDRHPLPSPQGLGDARKHPAKMPDAIIIAFLGPWKKWDERVILPRTTVLSVLPSGH